MASILVTGVGGVGGASTARWFAANTAHEPVGVDMDPRARGFLWVERGETVPPADADEWPAAMAGVVERHGVDVVVPLVDEELARLSALRAAVQSSVPFVCPTEQAIDRTLDKRRFAEWVAESPLPAPNSSCPDDECDLESPTVEFPAVVKPRLGHGSTGVERVDSVAELAAYFDRYPYDPGDVVVQEVVEGTEFTTSVVVTSADERLAIVPKEVIEKAGNTDWGVTRHDETVTETCRRLHETLAPHGPVNVQQIVDHETGEAQIVEINPRFSSTACLTARAGVDELDLLVRDALGESVERPGPATPDVHLVRSNADRFLTGDQLADLSFPAGSDG